MMKVFGCGGLALAVWCLSSAGLVEAFRSADPRLHTQSIRGQQLSMVLTPPPLLTSMDVSAVVPSALRRALMPVLPLCLESDSKTTVTDDPLAGMDPDQINSYITEIGGGMCGLPEEVRAFIGVALNLNLLVFGFMVVSYAITSVISSVLEKQVEDGIKNLEKAARVPGQSKSDLMMFAENVGAWPVSDGVRAMLPGSDSDKGPGSSGSGSSTPGGQGNRDNRRLQNKLRRQK